MTIIIRVITQCDIKFVFQTNQARHRPGLEQSIRILPSLSSVINEGRINPVIHDFDIQAIGFRNHVPVGNTGATQRITPILMPDLRIASISSTLPRSFTYGVT